MILLMGCSKPDYTLNVIPFKIVNNLPVITVEVNGKKAKFLLDTGSSRSLIDITVKDKYNFTANRNTGKSHEGIGNAESQLSYVNNINTYYGDSPMYINYRATNLKNLREIMGVIGIIGSDYFIYNELTIDFKNKQLIKQ